MNPFELQADFARQWLSIVGDLAKASSDYCMSMSNQAAGFWTSAMTAGVPARTSPIDGIMALWQPWVTPMSQPFNPFSAFTPQAMSFSAPQFSLPFAWPSWPMTAFAPPTQSLWSWPMATAGYSALPFMSNPFFSVPAPRNPASDFIDQAAAAYRTASGYAVATILKPAASALETDVGTGPWWMPSTAGHSRH